MNWWNNLQTGFGDALIGVNNPFGLAPPEGYDRQAAIRAGALNLGVNMLANADASPMEAIGRGYRDAQEQAGRQQMQSMAAQEMMARAEETRKKRQEEAERSQRWEQFISTLPAEQQPLARMFPERFGAELVQQQFPDPADPSERYKAVGKNLYDVETGQWIQSPEGADGIAADVENRKAAAEQMGLTPDDPAYRSYVLTGKMPREDQAPLTATDKKAILEADDAVMTNQAVIDQLNSVITPDQSGTALNDRAGYGMTAGVQSWAARNDPTGIFDDTQGEATTELGNIVLGQALTSLKSIFGSAPTEGERKILVDLQASIDKTPAERKKIIQRAIILAKARLAFNQKRAEGLRGETYYKPGGSPQSVTTEDGYTIEPVE